MFKHKEDALVCTLQINQGYRWGQWW